MVLKAKVRRTLETAIFNRFQQTAYKEARESGYRSNLEVTISKQLEAAGIDCEYEGVTLPYTQPEEHRRYTPDWILANGIVIEAKGPWETADRKKIKLIKSQYPELDLRMVFSRSKTCISKKSKTTYAIYCETIGLPYADKLIPESWLSEPVNERSLALIKEIQIRARY
jgi:hypothetical protein